MTKNKKNEYMNKKSVAYYSGLNGLELKEIEHGINDYMILVSGAWSGTKSVHRVKIQFYKNGDSFINLQGYKINLNEFIRM